MTEFSRAFIAWSAEQSEQCSENWLRWSDFGAFRLKRQQIKGLVRDWWSLALSLASRIGHPI